jgi:hypothetical protein
MSLEKFRSLANQTLGSFHFWSQDIYLNNLGITDPDYGVCAALVNRWL